MGRRLEGVSVYLDPAVRQWADKRAKAEGRSLSQFIARVMLDTSRVTARVAPKIEWPQTDPWAQQQRPAPAVHEHPTADELREIAAINQAISESGLIEVKLTGPADLRSRREELKRSLGADWPLDRDTPRGAATAEQIAEGLSPSEWDIPDDWVNADGVTYADQLQIDPDAEHRYWVPREGVAH